jgi:hypothetical protein
MLSRFSSRALLVAFGLGVAVLALGLLPRGTGAQEDCTGPDCVEVPSEATLGGGGGADMTIECKWELPDMSPGDLAMTYVDTYGNHDDTPGELADAPPCDPVDGCQDGRRHMMGITPNPDDADPADPAVPIKRQYEKWVAVHSTNIGDIVDVYWKVWEPYVADPPNGPNCGPGTGKPDPVTFDGQLYCFKYQHHATDNLYPPNDPLHPNGGLGSGGTMFADFLGNCGALQAMTDMFEAAVETGQMTSAEVTAIIDECWQGEKAILRVQEDVSKEQSYGEYRVEVTVVNSAGTTFQKYNYFDVLPFIHMRKDFTRVDWQTIQNNGEYTVSGDINMESEGIARADGTGVKPTIENVGNQEMFVNVHFDPLVLDSDTSKSITQFDTKFRASWKPIETIQDFDPVYASTWVCFDQHPLGSNQTGKIDFSVHPIAAQAGHYTGSIDVLGTGGACD